MMTIPIRTPYAGLICPDCGEPAIHGCERCRARLAQERDRWRGAANVMLAAWVAQRQGDRRVSERYYGRKV